MENRRRLQGFILALVHDVSATEDLLQEVSAVLWRKFDRFEEGTDFAAWAMAVARFQVLNWRRKQASLPLTLDEETLVLLADEAVVVACEMDERSEALGVCLERLSERNSRLVTARYQEGRSTQEIAGAEECTARSIRHRLEKIHRFLLDCIESQTATSTS